MDVICRLLCIKPLLVVVSPCGSRVVSPTALEPPGTPEPSLKERNHHKSPQNRFGHKPPSLLSFQRKRSRAISLGVVFIWVPTKNPEPCAICAVRPLFVVRGGNGPDVGLTVHHLCSNIWGRREGPTYHLQNSTRSSSREVRRRVPVFVSPCSLF